MKDNISKSFLKVVDTPPKPLKVDGWKYQSAPKFGEALDDDYGKKIGDWAKYIPHLDALKLTSKQFDSWFRTYPFKSGYQKKTKKQVDKEQMAKVDVNCSLFESMGV